MATLSRFFNRLFWAVVVLIVAFHLLVFALLSLWKTQPIDNSMFMLSHRLQGGSVSQQWVDYDHIAKAVKQAAIVSEDAKFGQHNGFDMQGIKNALKENERSGGISAGGSTITQQLAKNLFLTSQRSYIRKGEEAIITVMLEHMWSKQRILAAYLNVAEFGDGIYGVEVASQHYFGTSAAKLSRAQAALLIAMLPNPKYFEDHQNARRLRGKQHIIMRRMSHASLPSAS